MKVTETLTDHPLSAKIDFTGNTGPRHEGANPIKPENVTTFVPRRVKRRYKCSFKDKLGTRRSLNAKEFYDVFAHKKTDYYGCPMEQSDRSDYSSDSDSLSWFYHDESEEDLSDGPLPPASVHPPESVEYDLGKSKECLSSTEMLRDWFKGRDRRSGVTLDQEVVVELLAGVNVYCAVKPEDLVSTKRGVKVLISTSAQDFEPTDEVYTWGFAAMENLGVLMADERGLDVEDILKKAYRQRKLYRKKGFLTPFAKVFRLDNTASEKPTKALDVVLGSFQFKTYSGLTLKKFLELVAAKKHSVPVGSFVNTEPT